MSEWLEYLVNSAAWSAAGFAFGWVIGSSRREVAEVHQEVTAVKEHLMPDDDTQPPAKPRKRRRKHDVSWLGVTLIVLAVFSVGQTAYFANEQGDAAEDNRAITRCQARVNNAFAANLKERAEVVSADREALAALVDDLLADPDGNAVEALRVYRQKITANDRRLARNPYPPLPEQTCNLPD